jgi:hypothetical protein
MSLSRPPVGPVAMMKSADAPAVQERSAGRAQAGDDAPVVGVDDDAACERPGHGGDQAGAETRALGRLALGHAHRHDAVGLEAHGGGVDQYLPRRGRHRLGCTVCDRPAVRPWNGFIGRVCCQVLSWNCMDPPIHVLQALRGQHRARHDQGFCGRACRRTSARSGRGPERPSGPPGAVPLRPHDPA